MYYAGIHYMAFRDRDQIKVFARHFDQLVRKADLTSRETPLRFQQLPRKSSEHDLSHILLYTFPTRFFRHSDLR